MRTGFADNRLSGSAWGVLGDRNCKCGDLHPAPTSFLTSCLAGLMDAASKRVHLPWLVASLCNLLFAHATALEISDSVSGLGQLSSKSPGVLQVLRCGKCSPPDRSTPPPPGYSSRSRLTRFSRQNRGGSLPALDDEYRFVVNDIGFTDLL